jgi:lipoic acid synthetase
MHDRLPYGFRQTIPDREVLEISQLLSQFKVNTVCKEAKCPNISYCFKNKEATFLLLGNACTRNCGFCNVTQSVNTNLTVDEEEPQRIANLVKLLELKYVVITSVTRDDLLDGGAGQFAKTINLIRKIDKGIKIEVLIPDFKGRISSLECIVNLSPEVIAHNIETIRRLYPSIRPKADYEHSLWVLRRIKEMNPDITTKSSLILGIGEKEEEVILAIKDLRDSLCDILILGQYLAPSKNHFPIKEFIDLEKFKIYKDIAIELGFRTVLSGPLMRSSYKAEEIYKDYLCMT